MIIALSEAVVAKFGLYVLLPIFILFLFFIMWDISKQNNAGKQGTFWIFVALGAGFVGFLAKIVIEYVLEHWVL